MVNVDMCEHGWPGSGCIRCVREGAAALEAENARLREALGEVADRNVDSMLKWCNPWTELRKMIADAHAALETRHDR